MKIIDKIEIKHFRSFMGSTKEYEAAIYDLKDLNIFSGANDSGKSKTNGTQVKSVKNFTK